MRALGVLVFVAALFVGGGNGWATVLRVTASDDGGGVVLVRIELENETPVFALQVTILDDPDVLEFQEVLATARAGFAIVDANEASGAVIVVVLSLDPSGIVAGSGPIVEIRYSIRQGSASGTVLVEPMGVSIAGLMGLPIEAITVSVTLVLEGVPTVEPSPTGTPTSATEATPTPTARETNQPAPTFTEVAPSATTTSTATGSATPQVPTTPTGTPLAVATSTPTPRATPSLRGDVNCDGRVSSADTLAVSMGQAGASFGCDADPTCDDRLGPDALAVVIESLFLEAPAGPCEGS